MEFNYFDMIGCGESCLFPLLGIIFSPVLFPLYLILKIILIAIDFLSDVLESLFSKKNKTKEEPTITPESQIENNKKEQIERKIEELKREKSRIEEKIRIQEQELSNDNTSTVEVMTAETENPYTLQLK